MFKTLNSVFFGALAVAGLSACGGGNFAPPAGGYTGVLLLTEDEPNVAWNDWGMVTITIGDDSTVTGEVTFFNFGPKTLPPTDDYEVYEFDGTIGPDGFTATGDASEDDTFSVTGSIDENGLVDAEITADGLAGRILGVADGDDNIAVACGGFYMFGTSTSIPRGNAVFLQKASTLHGLFYGESESNRFAGTFTETLGELSTCDIDEGCGGSDSLDIEGELEIEEAFDVTVSGGFDYYATEVNAGFSFFELEGGGNWTIPDVSTGNFGFSGDTEICWD